MVFQVLVQPTIQTLGDGNLGRFPASKKFRRCFYRACWRSYNLRRGWRVYRWLGQSFCYNDPKTLVFAHCANCGLKTRRCLNWHTKIRPKWEAVWAPCKASFSWAHCPVHRN